MIVGTEHQRQAEIARWNEMRDARTAARIPPTDHDHKWFQKNRKSKDGWPRQFHVRPAIKSDHWAFLFGYVKPDGFITIIRNYEFRYAVVAADEANFGPMVDSDAYANMRLAHLKDGEAALAAMAGAAQ
jgi:hypothetical protein